MAGIFRLPVPPPEDTTPLPIDDTPPAAGPIANLAASLVTAAVGVLGAILAVALGVGSLAQPGPGLWPLGVSIVIAALSLIQIVVGRHGGDGEKFGRASWMAAAGFASLIVFVALLPIIGFEIPTLLMAFLWMRVLGHEKWVSTIVGSVLITVAFYLVFVVALQTSIPHLI